MIGPQRLILIAFLFICGIVRAQRDSVAIAEVVVGDVFLKNYSDAHFIISLSDSVLLRDPGSPTRLLQFQTPVYFKENGLGMVSSPSFRGTTAQQTALVWNGINLNSALNGQVDFNALALGSSMTVRPGGGSVLFGSSAIGGSIHYHSTLSFASPLKQKLVLQYGSFNTLNAVYKISAGYGNIGFDLNVTRNESENDYQFPDGRQNLNGQFYNTGVDASAGLKIDQRHYLRFYSRLFTGERHFPLFLPSETKTKYRDLNASNLLEWESRYRKVTTTAKVAYLNESYQYFANLEGVAVDGNAQTVQTRYDAAWQVSKSLTVHPVAEFVWIRGWGTNIRESQRYLFSGSALIKFRPLESLGFEGGIRQEKASDYDAPFLFSGGVFFKRAWYRLRFNGSRNFRIPSINDLYWTSGGNPNLKPESSWQTEVGQQFNWGPVELSVTFYALNIKDLIQWLPGESSEWFPRNVASVHVRGLEAFIRFDQKKGAHHLQIQGTYAYTKSEDRETQKQLIFVPFHKGTFLTAYSFRRFEVSAETLLTGEVFTRSDNNARYNLDGYTVVNGGVAFVFDNTKNSKIGFTIRNIGNSEYMTQPRRPYPGRHYAINLTLNF